MHVNMFYLQASTLVNQREHIEVIGVFCDVMMVFMLHHVIQLTRQEIQLYVTD